MLSRKMIFLGILMLLTASSVFAQGQERGNGTDDLDSATHDAWLVGSDGQEFEYCLNIDPKFNYDSVRFKKRLDRALSGWSRYFQEKGVIAELVKKGRPVPLTLAKEVKCSEPHHLTFYLGAEDSLVQMVKKQFNNPTAFAFKTLYIPTTTGTGFIWFANPGSVHPAPIKPNETIGFPNWIENDEVFDMFLIHEIGHAYGIPHVPGTIMMADLAATVHMSGKERRHIEWSRELVSYLPYDVLVKLKVRELDGQSTIGSSVEMTLLSLKKDKIEIDITDGSSKIYGFTFDIQKMHESMASKDEVSCYLYVNSQGIGKTCFSNTAFSLNGVATDTKGHSYAATFDYNFKAGDETSLGYPFRLKLFRNGAWETVVRAHRNSDIP